ncbi:MAG TPA: hypothetical protein VG345_06060 [Bryobacteraceae bacterium]|nr:hypothetical protein [Bryobacteraceae bacterium]
MAATASPAFAQVSKPWNTLRVLRASLFGLIGLDLLLLAVCVTGARVHREGMQTVGRDSAPSILAAQKIKTSLADMDASLASDLLAPSTEASMAARGEYEQRRREATQALVDAAQNITYGREERDPIERLQLQLGVYEARAQRALDLHDAHNPAALAAYDEAASLLNNVLLPAADELDAVNSRHLETSYASQGAWRVAARATVLFAGLALLAALLWLQSFLTDRTRRILNLPLLGATLIALALMMWALTVFGTEERQLKIAKRDAFASMHILWQARAAAYSARGDEVRFLLGSPGSAKAGDDFFRKVDSLLVPPSGSSLSRVIEDARDGKASGMADYFADELNNITFRDERESAVLAMQGFAEYLEMDRRLRELESSGRHAQAIALSEGDAKQVFARFDDALGQTTAINRRAFDMAIRTGFEALSNFDAKAAAAAALIALLVMAGLMQRIAEYR